LKEDKMEGRNSSDARGRSMEERDRPNKKREEYAIVLDFLQHGKPFSGYRGPLAQVVGINHFILLEVVPKQGVILKQKEKVYVGIDKREKIHHIKARINYDELTNGAKMLLEEFIENQVKKNEQKFIEFFNKAGAVSTRLHSLELLPGVGKTHMREILDKREYEPFKNFDDLRKRVSLMPDPEKIIIKRIIRELRKEDKYSIFVG